ncbi:MAG TPA: WD40 repeat domain-containing protein [Planctomycetota bacterium]|jgi:WD40 repeat protein|nr:WD40 repeat domain-containing protein [Planctomycetota bacterium]
MRRIPFLSLLALLGCSSTPPPPRPAPRAVLEAHASEVHAVAFSPDGSMFASAGAKAGSPGVDEITLWTTATGDRRLTFANYKDVVSCLAFSPDAKTLAVGSSGGRLALLEIESGTERSFFAGRAGRVASLSFSFDGKVLVSVVNAEEDKELVEVCRWDVQRGESRDTFTADAMAPVALSHEGGSLAWPVPGPPGGIRVLDLETKAERNFPRIAVHRGDSMVFSPDGKWLAAVHYEDWNPFPNHCPYLYIIDALSGRIRLRSPRPFDARRGLALSHDAMLLARGVDYGLQLWDLKTLEVRATAGDSPSHSTGAELLVFSPDDRTLVSTDGHGLLLLWDVPRLLETR